MVDLLTLRQGESLDMKIMQTSNKGKILNKVDLI